MAAFVGSAHHLALVHEKRQYIIHASVKDEDLGRRDLHQGVDALQHLHGPGAVAVTHQRPQGLLHGPHHVQLTHFQEGAPQGLHFKML